VFSRKQRIRWVSMKLHRVLSQISKDLPPGPAVAPSGMLTRPTARARVGLRAACSAPGAEVDSRTQLLTV
jgi:hypothetical protein